MRVKLQFVATAITALGILLGMVCKRLIPQYWTDWYVAVLAFFWVVEMVMSFVLERSLQPATANKRFMQTYLIAKGVKFVLTIVLIGVGIQQIGTEEKTETMVFAGSAVAFYLLHLAGETFLLTKKKNG